MTRMAFWLLIISMSALAQTYPAGLPSRTGGSSSSSGVSDCAALDGGVCATTAAMTLYVDPTGSDSNACTASGTSACLTLTSALTRVPRNIGHAVVINLAAGTYTESPTIGPFVFSTGGSLSIQGGWEKYTPAAGNATGTVTSYTAGTNGVPPSWTDSGQSWTTNALKGLFFRMTSGAFSGQVRAVITGNTATSVTMSANMAGLSGTYELVVPSATISGTVIITDISGVGTTSGPLSLSYLNITGTAVSGTLQISNSNVWGPGAAAGVFLRQTRVFSTTGGIACAVRGARVTTTSAGTYFEASAVGGVSAALYLYESSGTFYGYARTLGTASAITVRNSRLTSSASGFYPTVEAPAATAEVVLAYSDGAPTTMYVGNLVVRGNATSAGIRLGSDTSRGISSTSVQWVQAAIAPNTNIWVDTALTGLTMNVGSSVDLGGSVPAFTGVTNELQVDGTNYPYSFLSGLSPGVIIGPYGSTLYK